MGEAYAPGTNVYEHGIAVEGDEHPESLVLMATATLPIYAGFSLAIVDGAGRSLHERAVHLADVQGPYYSADYYEEEDLRYCMLATLYHLNRLIDLYVGVCQLFERIHPPGTARRGNTSDPRVFYEIDACLGAARRVYESMRKVLWKHYHGPVVPGEAGRWRSIRTVFTSPHDIPPGFLTAWTNSWNTVGETLADYRDCVAHYDPLTDGGTTCWMDWYGDRWGMTIKLPANPQAHSRRAFDFDAGPEALRYCHAVACHLVELCESLEAQPTVASYLANPRLDYPR